MKRFIPLFKVNNEKIIYLIILTFLTLSCKINEVEELSINEDEELIDFSKASGSFIDSRDNHEYQWVKLGNQVWMAENLAYLPIVCLVKPDSTNLPHYYIYGYDGTDLKRIKLLLIMQLTV